MDQLFPQSLQHSGSYIQVTIIVIMSCLRGFGLWFDHQLFAPVTGATALVELRVQEQVEEASQDINLRNGFCHDDQVDQVVDDDEGVPDDEHHLLFLGSHHVKHGSQAESYHSTKKLMYLVSIIKFSFPVKISFQFTKKRIDFEYQLSIF